MASTPRRSIVLCVSLLIAGSVAGRSFAQVEVIFSEVPGSPTAIVPGAMDLTGQPVTAEFLSMLDLAPSPTGDQWILHGSTQQGPDLANVLLLGSGAVGSVFAQEGQPVHGGVSPEVYEFFDGVAGFDSAGNFAYGARARDGNPDFKEKVIVFDGLTFTVVIQESDPALGLQDSTGPAGDETFGNSLNSIHLLDNGDVGFVAVTINNVSSANRPAIFYGNLGFAQSGFTPIGGDTWDGFDSNEFQTTPDGAHWFAMGDTFNSTDVLAVDGVIEISAGAPVPGTAEAAAAIFHTKMLTDGTWIARGDFADDTDWVVLDGTLLLRTGDPITAGNPELWGDAIGVALVSSSGDSFIAGNTSSLDPDADTVLVRNGDTILVREGDPVDLDGNGAFDDDTFLRSFTPNDSFVGSDGALYFLATLRNAIGANLGDTFLRLPLSPSGGGLTRGDCNADGLFNIADAVFVLGFLFPTGGAPTLSCEDACDANDDGSLNIADAVAALGTLFPTGPPIALPAPFPGCGDDPTTDSLGCGGFPACP